MKHGDLTKKVIALNLEYPDLSAEDIAKLLNKSSASIRCIGTRRGLSFRYERKRLKAKFVALALENPGWVTRQFAEVLGTSIDTIRHAKMAYRLKTADGRRRQLTEMGEPAGS